MSRNAKYLTSALAAVAVIATVAVAHTIHTHEVDAARATVGSGSMSSTAVHSQVTPSQENSDVGCGFAAGLNCDQVEQLLPQ